MPGTKGSNTIMDEIARWASKFVLLSNQMKKEKMDDATLHTR
jgi:hypothetical protein